MPPEQSALVGAHSRAGLTLLSTTGAAQRSTAQCGRPGRLKSYIDLAFSNHLSIVDIVTDVLSQGPPVRRSASFGPRTGEGKN